MNINIIQHILYPLCHSRHFEECVGYYGRIKEIITSHPDYNLDKVVIYTSKMGYLETLKTFVSLGADIRAGNDFAVQWASANGHLDVVKYLVSQGADIRAGDDFAVRMASRSGHLEVVKYLVSLG